MEQLVILLLIALISFINWLIKKSAELREAKKREAEAAQPEVAESAEQLPSPAPPLPEAEPEISMRRLREALGLPKEAEPPPLPKRAPEIPVPPPLRPRPIPVPAAIPHLPVSAAQLESARGGYRFIELPRGFVKPAKPSGRVAEKSSRVRELLGSTGGLRDAVVLSEILGPAKGLRERSFQ